MSAINVNSITGRTGSHGPVLTGVTTISGDLHVGSGLSVTGISTFNNTVVGGATTELVVGGDARITGILTIGTSSVTIDGTSGSSSITGVTTAGIGSFYGVDSINDLGYPSAGPLSNRNMIINGACMINQRHGAGTVDVTGTNQFDFPVDRFKSYSSGDGTLRFQRSDNAPTGFKNSLMATVQSADSSVASGEYYCIQHRIEGYNTSHLNWGTANAKTVTLSFWVRSSVAGTYGLSLFPSAQNYNYVHQYDINSADTWEYKTVTIPGPTAGSWNTTNDIGIGIWWDLGSGSTYETSTLDTWIASSKFQGNGQTAFITNGGATFRLTGIQLEVGTRATPFEHRSYSDELARCQRYCYRLEGNDFGYICNLATYTSDLAIGTIVFPVTMRAAPTQLITTGTAADYGVVMVSTIADCTSVPVINNGSQNTSGINFSSTGNMTGAGNGRFSADNTYLVFHGASEL